MQKGKRRKISLYPIWFVLPALTIFGIFFLYPIVTSFYYSMTVWNFDSAIFCGLENYRMFFSENELSSAVVHTLIYAFSTSMLKVIIAFFIAVFLCSRIRTKDFIRSAVFFPNLVSMMAVGLTFSYLMHPTKGLFNAVLTGLGFAPVDFLGDVRLALGSIIATDVWKGLSVSVVIYIAGIQSIDRNYYEAAEIDGASRGQCLRHITLPLVAPSQNTIIILSLIGGLRSFDLIWAMTSGGPGFATDVMASVIYKQYAYGFYGLSTAGNVIMLLLISVIAFPLQHILRRREEAIV
ncbi:carbohydrate ABC transporter permease [Lachnoclostridium sp. Marseille-P6806]|uniref:carbohydrate ABC transporter permease n=1 Tax=Lachnoclostridium sp. Marseille-P6806 TaxID=2364793 RepID=UPI001030D407|nr:sugar ABC transporter permease [Lachnoclostridium sp. Marseille-P6806]